MFVDTHCHLYMLTGTDPKAPLKNDATFLSDDDMTVMNDVVEKASAEGVSQILAVATNSIGISNVIKMAHTFEGVYATAGIHPCDVTKETWAHDRAYVQQVCRDAQFNKIHAVGEIGLDYYHKPYDAELQRMAFDAQLTVARECGLPAIVHVRGEGAGEDALAYIEKYARSGVRGVLHCFSLDQYAADRCVELGWCIGIGGPVTYPKNDQLRSIVQRTPLTSIVLETDTPFLPPQSMRGKRNCPSHIPQIAQAVAQCKGISREDVARVTTENAQRLFNL